MFQCYLRQQQWSPSLFFSLCFQGNQSSIIETCSPVPFRRWPLFHQPAASLRDINNTSFVFCGSRLGFALVINVLINTSANAFPHQAALVSFSNILKRRNQFGKQIQSKQGLICIVLPRSLHTSSPQPIMFSQSSSLHFVPMLTFCLFNAGQKCDMW